MQALLTHDDTAALPVAMALNPREQAQLRSALQEAVVKCSERCLYQSSKWYYITTPRLVVRIVANTDKTLSRAAELLNAIPEPEMSLDDPDVSSVPNQYTPAAFGPNSDPDEARLEAQEINKFLLAKSLFDCREYDRCAAVFLPDSTLAGVVASQEPSTTPKGKGKGKDISASTRSSSAPPLPRLSQRSLFLALYAKVLAGEKRKDEDAEMVMGPQDLGTCINKQLLSVSRYLGAWFDEHKSEEGEDTDSQGWLEYL